MNNVLLSLMRSLIYPACLGAGIVWFVSTTLARLDAGTAFLGEPAFYIAFLLLVSFCSPFIILVREQFRQPYGSVAFAIDIVTCLIIIGAFAYLGFVEGVGKNIRMVYWLILAIPVVAGLGNRVLKRRILWQMSLIVVVAMIAMALWGYAHEWANWLTVGGLYVVLARYLFVVATEQREA